MSDLDLKGEEQKQELSLAETKYYCDVAENPNDIFIALSVFSARKKELRAEFMKANRVLCE